MNPSSTSCFGDPIWTRMPLIWVIQKWNQQERKFYER